MNLLKKVFMVSLCFVSCASLMGGKKKKRGRGRASGVVACVQKNKDKKELSQALDKKTLKKKMKECSREIKRVLGQIDEKINLMKSYQQPPVEEYKNTLKFIKYERNRILAYTCYTKSREDINNKFSDIAALVRYKQADAENTFVFLNEEKLNYNPRVYSLYLRFIRPFGGMDYTFDKNAEKYLIEKSKSGEDVACVAGLALALQKANHFRVVYEAELNKRCACEEPIKRYLEQAQGSEYETFKEYSVLLAKLNDLFPVDKSYDEMNEWVKSVGLSNLLRIKGQVEQQYNDCLKKLDKFENLRQETEGLEKRKRELCRLYEELENKKINSLIQHNNKKSVPKKNAKKIDKSFENIPVITSSAEVKKVGNSKAVEKEPLILSLSQTILVKEQKSQKPIQAYADRVDGWFDNPWNELQKQNYDMRLCRQAINKHIIKCHAFPRIVDDFIDALASTCTLKNEDGKDVGGFVIPGQLIDLETNKKENGFFSWAINDDKVCYHRCFSKTELEAMRNTLNMRVYKTDFPALGGNKNKCITKKNASKNSQDASVTVKEDDLFVTITDKSSNIKVILYKTK